MIWPRFVIAALLLALPIWAGAASRSLWLAPVLIGVFTIAYIDGKHRIWREQFAASGAGEKLKTIAGAILTQTILVAILYLLAVGASYLLGQTGPRAPFGRLDAALSAGGLAAALLGGALVRKLEGGRDPMDRALESLQSTIDEWDQDDVDDDYDREFDEVDLTDEIERIEALEEEADILASRETVTEPEINALANRFVAADIDRRAASLLRLAASDGAETGEAYRRRVGLRGLLFLARENAAGLAPILAEIQQAVLGALAPGGSAELKLDALTLAETLGLGGDTLLAALQALQSIPGETGHERLLKDRAARMHERISAP